MAKQAISRNGTARIRFIMLDAEIPEGDLNQVTIAIQNALKPTTIVQPRLAVSPPQPVVAGAVDLEAANDFDEPATEEASSTEPTEFSRPPRESRPRKLTVPKVLDLDLTSGTSLASFVDEHPPKNDTERNLVVAAWFKEHRDEDAITAGHVYTCYRALKWPSGIEDFSWPLRSLKKDQLMASTGRGLYAINHLGLARVQKLKV